MIRFGGFGSRCSGFRKFRGYQIIRFRNFRFLGLGLECFGLNRDFLNNKDYKG